MPEKRKLSLYDCSILANKRRKKLMMSIEVSNNLCLVKTPLSEFPVNSMTLGFVLPFVVFQPCVQHIYLTSPHKLRIKQTHGNHWHLLWLPNKCNFSVNIVADLFT